ncbi:hypothetical protein H9L39_07529 [Fusarium oxysporum f. sp. albedinis]|nr:hypothetical protein H9L39_07529 [Fusarium oxysporum f. sp. albedinis]
MFFTFFVQFYKWQNHKYRSASPYPAKRDQSKDQRGQVQSIDKRYSARAKLYQHIRSMVNSRINYCKLNSFSDYNLQSQ